MNKSVSFAIVLVSVVALRLGVLASPAVSAFVEDSTAASFGNLSLAWLTAGAIGFIIGGLGIFHRRML